MILEFDFGCLCQIVYLFVAVSSDSVLVAHVFQRLDLWALLNAQKHCFYMIKVDIFRVLDINYEFKIQSFRVILAG